MNPRQYYHINSTHDLLILKDENNQPVCDITVTGFDQALKIGEAVLALEQAAEKRGRRQVVERVKTLFEGLNL